MTFLAKFERNFLFGLTRALAMFFIFSTLATLIISGLFIASTQLMKSDVEVKPQEVIEILKPTLTNESVQPNVQQPVENSDTPKLPTGLKLPFTLQKYFSSPKLLRLLVGWLDKVPKNQQQTYLDEMAGVVTEAEKEHLDPYNAIDTYNKLKMEKLEAEKIASAEKNQTRLWYAGALGTGIIIIALFSLILVLLAIERNTRGVNA